jgi:hypothetical protein
MEAIKQIYIYPLARAERAMVGLFPLLMLGYGAFVANIVFLLLIFAIVGLLWALGDPYQAAHFLGEAIATVITVSLAYFLYGNAITKLSRVASVLCTIFFGVLALWQIPDGIARIASRVPQVPPYLGIAAAAVLIWITVSIACGWLRIALGTDQDRLLLRAPFSGVMNRLAIQFFSGLPPIIIFVKRGRARIFIVASSFFFAVAFLTLTVPAHGIVNAESWNTQIVLMIAAIVTAPTSVLAANAMLRRGQANIRFSIDEISAADPRPPILFLRAFRDDQVALANPRFTLLGRLFAIATSIICC